MQSNILVIALKFLGFAEKCCAINKDIILVKNIVRYFSLENASILVLKSFIQNSGEGRDIGLFYDNIFLLVGLNFDWLIY